MQKTFISANQLLRDSYALALLMLRSGYRPDLIAGIWRGGTPVAIAVHEVCEFAGLSCEHLAIRTASYSGIDQRQSVVVEGLDYLARKCGPHTRLLLVDDVFDSGQSMAAVLDEMLLHCTSHMPEVRIAVPYYKPTHNTTNRIPDFYLHESTDWLVFPHELCGLNPEELRQKPGLDEVAEQLLTISPSNNPQR